MAPEIKIKLQDHDLFGRREGSHADRDQEFPRLHHQPQVLPYPSPVDLKGSRCPHARHTYGYSVEDVCSPFLDARFGFGRLHYNDDGVRASSPCHRRLVISRRGRMHDVGSPRPSPAAQMDIRCGSFSGRCRPDVARSLSRCGSTFRSYSLCRRRVLRHDDCSYN